MFTLTSPEIVERGVIPTRYANGAWGVECGENISPPFNWDGAPEGTRSFALTCVDPDVPLEEEWFPYKEQLKVGTLPGDLFIHWIVYDIPVSIKALVERASPYNMPSGANELVTSFGTAGYGGPAPPKGHKAHAYIFTIYAFDVESLGLPKEAGYVDFINAIKGKILATASVTGYFSH